MKKGQISDFLTLFSPFLTPPHFFNPASAGQTNQDLSNPDVLKVGEGLRNSKIVGEKQTLTRSIVQFFAKKMLWKCSLSFKSCPISSQMFRFFVFFFVSFSSSPVSPFLHFKVFPDCVGIAWLLLLHSFGVPHLEKNSCLLCRQSTLGGGTTCLNYPGMSTSLNRCHKIGVAMVNASLIVQ